MANYLETNFVITDESGNPCVSSGPLGGGGALFLSSAKKAEKSLSKVFVPNSGRFP